jgi:prevent-host-death family protein
MTRHIPISEFKDHTSELVAAAENGEEIVITRHGRPAVVLKAFSDLGDRRQKAREAMDRILARREQMRAAGMTATIEELIAWKNEGQR